MNVTFKSDFADCTDSQNKHQESVMKDANDEIKITEPPYTSLSRNFDDRTTYDVLK